MKFDASLKFGQVGESAIAKWMRSRGWYILPIYEKEIDEGKGPRLFTPTTTLIGTDMLAFKGSEARWIEAKHKSAFTWHRKTARFTTGIDLHHYEHYCHIDSETPWPVWLMFLHREGRAKDTPDDKASPTGLYGNTLAYLQEHENHRSDKHAKGMVYWAEDKLIRLATLKEVRACDQLAALQSRGIEVRKEGELIKLTAPQGVITERDCAGVAAMKPQLLRLLEE